MATRVQRQRAYRERPDVRARRLAYMRGYHQRKKAERAAAAAEAARAARIKMVVPTLEELEVPPALVRGVEETGRFPCGPGLTDLCLAAIRRWPMSEMAKQQPRSVRRGGCGL